MQIPETTNLIFVYGTLLKKEGEPLADYLRQNAAFMARGYFYGKLYEIKQYPGACLSNNKNHKVYGSIFKLNNNSDEILKKLDEYEETGEHFSSPNEYVRQIIEVMTHRKKYYCHAYIYNWETDEKKRITSGDYLRWVM